MRVAIVKRKKLSFEEWAEANPHIIAGVTELADRLRARGRTRWSAWAAINVLRWQTAMRDTTQTEYKISNNEIAHIARLYNRRAGFEFFATKPLKNP
jgi:hypothetical protein